MYGQRAQYFNHFLIAAAFLSAGYVTALGARLYIVAAIVGLVGSLISLVFRQMDRRLREYAHAGEKPLKIMQARLANLLGVDEMKILEALDRPKSWYAHSLLLNVVFLASSACFLAAMIFALLKT
ncbi:hypothetical protein [Acrocarpospora catenulata]|uniref:hypothetical protein n=1 Tax=Acrocarpospora catenulata TaxID=2836182 RepID=UPI001BDB65C7|nr:hypothetical protein [Acrocarpospora catenulata]